MAVRTFNELTKRSQKPVSSYGGSGFVHEFLGKFEQNETQPSNSSIKTTVNPKYDDHLK